MALCNMCIFQLQVSQDDMETAHALEQVCDYSVEEMHSHKKELVQIISRHLSSDNARVLFPLGKKQHIPSEKFESIPIVPVDTGKIA